MPERRSSTASDSSRPESRPLVALSLGSNQGNREATLALARRWLSIRGALSILKESSLYHTEPVDCPPQPWFLNQVLWVAPALPPALLLAHCRDVEARLGRHRRVPKGPRSLDVDILFYGDLVIRTPLLTLPHPALPRRRSILLPLAELAMPWRHPQLGISVPEMLRRCADPGRVALFLPELDQ